MLQDDASRATPYPFNSIVRIFANYCLKAESDKSDTGAGA